MEEHVQDLTFAIVIQVGQGTIARHVRIQITTYTFLLLAHQLIFISVLTEVCTYMQ